MSNLPRYLAILLILAGLVLIGLIYFPILNQEIRYQTLVNQAKNEIQPEIIPQSLDFGLVIPKIGVNTQIFANVDPDDPAEYLPLLVQGVAHAKGSQLPGEQGTVFLFAHSADSPLNITRYNAVFYLINKLKPDDQIIVYYQREKYLYQVIGKKIVAPELVEEYLYSLKKSTLVLQTCYPPGTSINRLLVVAEEVD